MIRIADITGLVLAGGKGERMGGVDKGLQAHVGIPLALHAVRRLAPQVGELVINANRNREAYEAMGSAVFADSLPDHAGPLAGFLAGLQHCKTPYLVTVPCDSPRFPADLVERLAAALEAQGADIAMAATREGERLQVHPVFCLLKTSLRGSLAAFTASGQRKIDRWTALHRTAQVVFEDEQAFVNANTLAELDQLKAHG
jgi:molybdopterin-guanine dinucleotide biosynthesis protein A